jgi:hypothetical protein
MSSHFSRWLSVDLSGLSPSDYSLKVFVECEVDETLTYRFVFSNSSSFWLFDETNRAPALVRSLPRSAQLMVMAVAVASSGSLADDALVSAVHEIGSSSRRLYQTGVSRERIYAAVGGRGVGLPLPSSSRESTLNLEVSVCILLICNCV